jgi:hypothetical protein
MKLGEANLKESKANVRVRPLGKTFCRHRAARKKGRKEATYTTRASSQQELGCRDSQAGRDIIGIKIPTTSYLCSLPIQNDNHAA